MLCEWRANKTLLAWKLRCVIYAGLLHNCYQLPLIPKTFCRLRVFHESSDCPTTAVVYIYEPTISNICFCNLCTRLYSAKTLPFGQSLRPCAPLPCPSSHLLADSTQTAALQMLKLLESRQREQLGHWSLYVDATPWSAAVLCGTVRVFSRWRCGTMSFFRNSDNVSVSNNFHVEAVHHWPFPHCISQHAFQKDVYQGGARAP